MPQTRDLPFTPIEFRDIFSRTPRATVEILLLTEAGIVLVQRQEASWHGQWHVPGGSVFYREHVVDTIRRVGQEELGIAVEPIEFQEYVEYWDEVRERGYGYSLGLAHICRSAEPITPEILAKWQAEHIGIYPEIPPNTIREQQPMIRKALEWRAANLEKLRRDEFGVNASNPSRDRLFFH